MTKSNSSATLSTSNLYEHPWYSQLNLLDGITTCESPLQPKLKSEVTGQRYTKRCVTCKQTFDSPDFFTKNRSNSDGLHHECRSCVQHTTAVRRQLRKTAPYFSDTCECCGTKSQVIHIDHDHKTLEFRGWLCGACNRAIGMLGDNIEGLQKAINYLNGNQI